MPGAWRHGGPIVQSSPLLLKDMSGSSSSDEENHGAFSLPLPFFAVTTRTRRGGRAFDHLNSPHHVSSAPRSILENLFNANRVRSESLLLEPAPLPRNQLSPPAAQGISPYSIFPPSTSFFYQGKEGPMSTPTLKLADM